MQPLWLLLALVAIAVVVLGVLTVRDRVRLDPLPEPVHTPRPLELPADRPLTADDVRAARFETGLRGYDPGPVDAHLELWIQYLSPAEGEAPPRPEVGSAIFPVVLRGYRMDQVDALLATLDR